MIECGKITKIKRNNATVTFDRKSACDQCHMCAVSKSGKTVEIVIPNKLGASIGDVVEVSMGNKYVLTSAFIVYVIPLILVIIAIFAFRPLGEIAQIIGTIAAVALGFIIAIFLDRFVIRKKQGFVPEMTRIVIKAGFDSNEDTLNEVTSSVKNTSDDDQNI